MGEPNGVVNGHTEYGETAVSELLQEAKAEKKTVSKLSEEHDLVLKTFRVLIADLCQQFNMGHPGGAIGMAAIGVALWKDMVNTEDVNAKMRACGFEVIDVEDGCFDVDGIVKALQTAKNSSHPTFVNIRTIIGLGSDKAGNAVAHGAPFGKDDVANMKRAYSFDTEQHLLIGPGTRKFFQDIPSRGEELVRDWNSLLEKYEGAHPEVAKEFKSRMVGQIPSDWESYIPSTFPTDKTPTRKSNGLVFNPIASKINSFMVGTADLTPSVNLHFSSEPFNHPSINPHSGPEGSYKGRYIHYGIREHAMASISNGLAAFSPNTIIPVTSSFFMFYLYAGPGVRMSALSNLHTIHVATHDSIGAGEDGPTHQPIELAALYRAMPNFLYIRPADTEEVAGAWSLAITTTTLPTMISVSRHAVPQLSPRTSRSLVARGAYPLSSEDDPSPHLTLLSCGAELTLALSTASLLRSPPYNLHTRVVSVPCFALFNQQPLPYRREVLQRHAGVPAVAIEAYSSLGWERYADAGFCMRSFGKSLPGPDGTYGYFGFEPENMARRIAAYLDGLEDGTYERGEFVELQGK
ncbi:MAG: hypothetical protein Q9227_007580 [Pyrenula ochraceoflavens]